MIVERAEVSNYKCFKSYENVNLEKDVTCLVGKNESGKTAFLESLYKLNPSGSGDFERFSAVTEYPRTKYNRNKDEADSERPISVTLKMENKDTVAINNIFDSNLFEKGDNIVVSKDYSNEIHLSLDLSDKKILEILSEINDESKIDWNEYDSFENVVQYVSQDSQIDISKEEIIKKRSDVINDIRERVLEKIPIFIYFGNYSTLPGRFSISRILGTNESNLNRNERTALSLFRYAGIEEGEVKEQHSEERTAALEAASISLTDEVFEYWSQNENLSVDIKRRSEDDLDPEEQQEIDGNPPYLELRVRNLRNRMTIRFDFRSAGFVWFFSFLTYFSEFKNTENDVVLLLDEPGLNLHGSAQGDLLRFIDERLSPSCQVIYTTHSPFMVDSTNLERCRTMEIRDDEGAVVSQDVLTVDRDTIFPLQAALGYELSQTLFVSPDNLIVEGPSDIIYLEVMSQFLKDNSRAGLNNRWSLVPAGGLDKIPTFIALFGTQLNISVILDVSASGNQRVRDMVDRGLLEPDKLFPLTDITNKRESDIEDLFTNSFYLKLISGAGIADLNVSDLKHHTRIVKRIERTIGEDFDHYSPASYLLRNQESLLSQISDATLDRFEELFSNINRTLS